MANESGEIAAVQLWGRVCGRQGGCDVCPISVIRGANVTCPEFAEKFPEKFLSVLKEIDADEGTYTYYSEFCLRFPQCRHSVENLAKLACRRAIFQGEVECPYAGNMEKCVDCWKKPYEGDIDSLTPGNEPIPTSQADTNFDAEAAIDALLN